MTPAAGNGACGTSRLGARGPGSEARRSSFGRARTLIMLSVLAGCVDPADARQVRAGSAEGLRVEQHAPPQQTGNKDIQVRTSVSRTAVWIGDRVEFVVEALLAPNMDVIDEDLSKEKLKLSGLEVVAAANERVVNEKGGSTRRFRYQLTTYQAGEPALTIGPQVVRYYVRRPGERPQDVQPVGEVQVAPVVIARRSTLPDELPGLQLRDAGDVVPPPQWLAIARPAGIGLAVLAAAPLALWMVGLVRSARTRERRPSARAVRSHARAAMDELRALDASTESGRLEAYTRLEQALRQHLAEKRGIPAQALSAREVAARLGATPDADITAELLAECERTRYGPPNRVPPLERYNVALQRAEHILGTAP